MQHTMQLPDRPSTQNDALVARIDGILPQTQCRQCDFPDCRAYADAIADGRADINQCPPGGDEGIARLAQLMGRPVIPLNPVHGIQKPFVLALIEEEACIGCTLCIQACPVDAIIGAAKQMHTVLADACTGCELCIEPCPVDCIVLVEGPEPATAEGRQARADDWRSRHQFHLARMEKEKRERLARLNGKARAKLSDPTFVDAEKRARVEAALNRREHALEDHPPVGVNALASEDHEAEVRRRKLDEIMKKAARIRQQDR